jgi:hypothetical protein
MHNGPFENLDAMYAHGLTAKKTAALEQAYID